MKHARWITAARLEFLAQIIYHNEAQPGLGERFTAAVEEAVARAVAFPLSEGIVVFALAHHSQRPFSIGSLARVHANYKWNGRAADGSRIVNASTAARRSPRR